LSVVPRVDVPDGPGGPPVQIWNLRPELLPTVQAMIDGRITAADYTDRERLAIEFAERFSVDHADSTS